MTSVMDFTSKLPNDYATVEDCEIRPDKDRHKKHEKDEEVDDLLTNSGIGALAKSAAATRKTLKVFWVLLFFCALSGFTSNVYHILYRYYRVPILTQLNQEYGRFTWPHVTICNPSNPIPFWRSSNLTRKWNDLLQKAKEYPRLLYHGGGKAVTMFPHYYLMSSINPHEFYNDMEKSVFLSMQVLFQQESLTTSSGDFDRYVPFKKFHLALDNRLDSSRYPIPCFTIKPETIAQLSEDINDPSELMAIKFALIMDFNSYKLFNSGFENRKLYMFLSKSSEAVRSSSLYFIYPGTDSTFTVTENRYLRIRGCDDNRFKVEMYNLTMTSTKTYIGGYETCREYLSQRLYNQKCGCYNPFLSIYKVSNTLPRLCLNMSLYNSSELKTNLQCLNDVIANQTLAREFNKSLIEKCQRYKRPLCHQRTYTYVRNTNKWNLEMSDSRRKLMHDAVKRLPNSVENASESFVNLNLAMVKIRRAPGLVTATLEEYEYPLSQLLSDIGGTMGLWLGISVISMFEILEFVLLLCRLLVRRRQRGKGKE